MARFLVSLAKLFSQPSPQGIEPNLGALKGRDGPGRR